MMCAQEKRLSLNQTNGFNTAHQMMTVPNILQFVYRHFRRKRFIERTDNRKSVSKSNTNRHIIFLFIDLRREGLSDTAGYLFVLLGGLVGLGSVIFHSWPNRKITYCSRVLPYRAVLQGSGPGCFSFLSTGNAFSVACRHRMCDRCAVIYGRQRRRWRCTCEPNIVP